MTAEEIRWLFYAIILMAVVMIALIYDRVWEDK